MDEQKQIEKLNKMLYRERLVFPDLDERAKNVRYEYDRLRKHVDYDNEEKLRKNHCRANSY